MSGGPLWEELTGSCSVTPSATSDCFIWCQGIPGAASSGRSSPVSLRGWCCRTSSLGSQEDFSPAGFCLTTLGPQPLHHTVPEACLWLLSRDSSPVSGARLDAWLAFLSPWAFRCHRNLAQRDQPRCHCLQGQARSFSFFHFFLNYWSIVDLQGCDNFCCTTKRFSYTCTYIHSLSHSFPT